MTYSASAAQAGRGSTLSIGATPTLIGELDNVPFDLPEWSTDDVTNFESGSDEEFIVTIRKSMEFTVTGNRVSSDAGQQAVQTAYAAGGSPSAFVLQLPKTPGQTTNGDKYAFNALILSQSFKIETTKKISFAMKLKTSGPVTFTAGS
jgi:hypothetical protein